MTNASLMISGIAYGMVLFLISVGLTVTLGVMRVVNLAHCGFAMTGGYIALALAGVGMGFIPALMVATGATICLGLVLERTLYRWVYTTSQLGQLLMTIGLAFIMEAAVSLLFGSSPKTLPIPDWMAGSWELAGLSLSRYRVFIVVLSSAVGIALWLALEFTTFGAKLRAAVDNPRMARCSGIDVPRIFAATFALGCGLAAAGGIVGAQLLPLSPIYAFRLLVPALMVVSVGGLGSLQGSLAAALFLAVADTFGRYYVPAGGPFIIYAAVVGALLVRPQGLVARG